MTALFSCLDGLPSEEVCPNRFAILPQHMKFKKISDEL